MTEQTGGTVELAQRAVAAYQAGIHLYVSHEEYRVLRQVETETWDSALTAECARLGITTPMLESVQVIRTAQTGRTVEP